MSTRWGRLDHEETSSNCWLTTIVLNCSRKLRQARLWCSFGTTREELFMRRMLCSAERRSRVNSIFMALSGKSVDFTKVIAMIDETVSRQMTRSKGRIASTASTELKIKGNRWRLTSRVTKAELQTSLNNWLQVESRRRSRFHSHSLLRKQCDQKSDAWSWKRPSESKELSVRLLPGLSTKQPEIKNEVEMKAKPNAAEVKETSRAKSIWHVERNQIATVLNSIHQFKIQAHRLDRSRSAQEINKHVFGGINKDREDQRSERLQQIQSWVGRCHGHIPARDFDHWEREAKNSAFLQKEIDTKEPEQHQDSSHQKELKVKSLQRTVFMMMKRTTEQISDVTVGNTAALVGIDQFL